jgi:hypothetical protein
MRRALRLVANLKRAESSGFIASRWPFLGLGVKDTWLDSMLAPCFSQLSLSHSLYYRIILVVAETYSDDCFARRGNLSRRVTLLHPADGRIAAANRVHD